MIATPHDGRTHNPRDGGFILVPVILTLALLAVISIVLTRTVATDVKASANLLRKVKLASINDGLMRLSIRYVLSKGVDIDHAGIFQLTGKPVYCAGNGYVSTISVISSAGLVDINSASEDTLEGLFSGIGAPAPKNLAAAVVDFRDIDDETSPGGAELPEYQANGLAYGPKNSTFTTETELDQVLGMTPELMARARPLITVHSGLPSPDLTVAGAAIAALSLPGETPLHPQTRSLQIRVTVRAGPNARAAISRYADVLVEPRAQGGFLLKQWGAIDLREAAFENQIGDAPSCISALSVATG